MSPKLMKELSEQTKIIMRRGKVKASCIWNQNITFTSLIKTLFNSVIITAIEKSWMEQITLPWISF